MFADSPSRLVGLRAGDKIRVTGAHGHFTLRTQLLKEQGVAESHIFAEAYCYRAAT